MNAITMIEPIEAAPRALAVVSTPSDLLRMAVEQGADLDRLERLMALQERWEAAQAVKAYNDAFTAFKAEAVRIIKNRGVTDGPLKGKRYAELYAVVNAITPALSKHGLSASWKLTKDDKDWIEITCILKHSAGHFETVAMGGPPDAGGAKNAIMARASTVSYLERYTLKAITGLSEQNDDNDGASSEEPDDSDDPVYIAFRDASLQGEAALVKHYDANIPTEAFWKRHSKALKDAARAVDKRSAR